MKLSEFEEFEQTPTVETAMVLGRALTKLDAPVEDKRMVFGEAFRIAEVDDKLEAIINMWTTAAMLEAPLPNPQIVQAVRQVLKDPQITPAMIEEWANLIYDVNRAPKDVLDFIAIDIRNLKGISKELRARLGHPNPENPSSK